MSTAPTPGRWHSGMAWLLIAVTAGCLLWGLAKGWVPIDDGVLAHTADRVRVGELPHKDFDEPYTGGLTFVNAFVLEEVDDSMMALRLPMFVMGSLAMAALYALLRRCLSPLQSAVLTSGAVSMSVFVHPTPMPSWYNVFFAVISMYFVVRYLESHRPLWLFLAGLSGGTSILVKVTGAFFVLACGLLLAAIALGRSRRERVLGRTALVIATGLVVGLIMTIPSLGRALLLVVPFGLLLLGIRPPTETLETGGGEHRLVVELTLLAAGVLSPILVFGAWYGLQDSLPALIGGLSRVSGGLLEILETDFHSLLTGLLIIPIALVVRLLSRWDLGGPTLATLVVAMILGGYAANARIEILTVYRLAVWLPLLISLSVLFASRSGIRFSTAELAIVCSAMCSGLLLFPNANPFYLIYASFLLLPAAAVAASKVLGPKAHLVLVGVLLASSAVFFLGKIEGRFPVSTSGLEPLHYVELDIPRLGLSVPQAYEIYVGLLAAVEDIDEPGGSLVAGPSSPEIYYLAAAPNPTPLTLDHLRRPGELMIGDYVMLLAPSSIVVNLHPPIAVDPMPTLQAAERQCESSVTHGDFVIFGSCRAPSVNSSP